MGKLYFLLLTVLFSVATLTAEAQKKQDKEKEQEEMEGFSPNNQVFTDLITFNTKGASKQEIENFKKFFDIRNRVDSIRNELGKQIIVDEKINDTYNVIYYSLEYLFVSQRYDNCGPILDMVEVYIDFLEELMLAVELEK
ncbi:MAG TPA: hypothetical protein DDY13_19170 [Cytophagales bacterium]|jgi:hypothetical protein|nr:hypothetical protein [Cytophagales bacterium]